MPLTITADSKTVEFDTDCTSSDEDSLAVQSVATNMTNTSQDSLSSLFYPDTLFVYRCHLLCIISVTQDVINCENKTDPTLPHIALSRFDPVVRLDLNEYNGCLTSDDEVE